MEYNKRGMSSYQWCMNNDIADEGTEKILLVMNNGKEDK